ncbi:MAG: hypothetical protein UV68_C0027G0010 [Candidatus Collierbacteria bacterium GW2011_GWC2_43_12]|uniref:Uncharacterized protein n=2 Tax=Candidatus Collieribacteriota TaxID=1752725 RepID=A0A0G1D605_9BACT|nr:MAG: hypothetical protein UV68_C0027G0010 [Candidatus Collierbacteria bacterium GW2011_GWC2_43_12]
MRSSLDKLSSLILRFIPFVLAFLTPLFFLPFTADPFTLNKFYLVTLLASISLISWCVRSLIRGKLSLTSSPALLPLILLVIAHVISSVWLSPTKHASLFGQTAFFIALLIIFLTTTSSQKSRVLVNSVVFGTILSATLLSFFTLLQYFGVPGRIFSYDLLDNTLLNPTGGILIALIYTVSVMLSTIGYLIVSKNWLHKSLLFAATIFMIVASLINISLIFPQSGQQVIFLLPYRASWSIAVDIFKNWQTALLGTGPDTYLSVFTRLRPGYLNVDNALWALRFPESSSFFLTLITTTGLVGALSFITAFLKPFLVSFRHRSSHTDEPTYIFLSLCLLTVLISFIFSPTSLTSIVLGIVALIALTVEFKLLGLKSVKDISLAISAKSEPETFYQDIKVSEGLHPYSVILPWIVTLLSAVLLSFYWIYAIPSYSASIEIKQAAEMIGTNPVGAYQKEINAAKLDPYNSSYPMLLSQFFKNAALSLLNKKEATTEDKKNASEYMQRSIDFGKQAATLNPYSVLVWENLADIYQSFIGVAEGASNFAVSHLAQAVALDPTNPELRLKLGILFFNLGDSDQAIKLLSQSIELKQNWDIPYYNMGLIYRTRNDNTRALQYLKAGLKFADPSSDNYYKFQQEITAIEKLSPKSGDDATSSATPK